MKYSEDFTPAKKFKEEYVQSFEALIEKRQEEGEKARAEYIKGVFENQEKYRNDFKEMLGWPLVNYEGETLPKVIYEEKLSEEDTYTLYRMQFEVLGCLKITGLFFKVKGDGKKPLVIVQHGGMGTPEAISGVYGDTLGYYDMLQRVVMRGAHVFAPQLLLWAERYEVKYDRQAVDAKLKRVGSSVTAVELFAIQMIMNYFEAKDYIKNFGMVGLSYGGFYTLYTAAIDERIKSAISCSYFNKLDNYHWSDWVWDNSAYTFDDAEVACLVYPRYLCIEMGKKDEVFTSEYTMESFEKLKKYSERVGTDWLNLVIFDDGHVFCKDDEPMDKLANDLKEEM